MVHVTHAASTLTCAGLRTALRAAFPGVVLVPAWVLREMIVHDRPSGAGLFVPRRLFHVIEREQAMALARRERLPIDRVAADADWLVLLPQPDSEWLESTPAPQVLRRYWRLLFLARVSGKVRGRVGLRGGSSPGSASESLRRQLDWVGRAPLYEIRQVLHEERLVPAGATDEQVYAEFVAVYLELFYFDRPMLRRFFPSIPDSAPVVEWMGQAIDAEALWRQTRPAGAADPPHAADPCETGHDESAAFMPVASGPPDPSEPVDRRTVSFASGQEQQALLTAADRATARGNDVRAALLHTEAFQLGGARAGINYAGRDLDALAERLASVREIGSTAAPQWAAVLRPLLAPIARGWWNQQARLLYDLQKVCVENEREAVSINLVEWALDRGRRPLRRPQPRQRLVLMVKHLHSAQHRLSRIRLAADDRAKLNTALKAAAHDAETHLHEELYPVVLSALQSAGLRPCGHAETVAENKLVEELLDTVVRKGFLALGDLRDAISRNAMKLDDLDGPGEFTHGDQLLRIDRKLAIELDGVYRRGEVYRRGFQRFSSLLFADNPGRLLTRTTLIPLGGAFLVLEGLEHTVGLVIHLIFNVHADLGVGVHGLPKHGEPLQGWKVPGVERWVDHPIRYLIVVLLFFLLANWPAFRVAAGHMLHNTGRGLRWLFVGFPGWLASQPIVRAIVRSPVLRLGVRYVVKPLVLACLAYLVLPRALGIIDRVVLGGGAFLGANLLLNSRRVRALEGALLHSLRIAWERFTVNFLAGLYHLVMAFFEAVLEYVDRMLYHVDEWLRFRSGQGQAAFVAKALLGVGWFYVAYATRFVINLLIEPQLNPIKHFPVVTVSHKIILPQAGLLADAFEALGMARARAFPLSLGILALVPGMFGFLAWELLSNWKLYKSNRPAALRPVQVGSHGESIARLLRPGIHSGTIPKAFARLRRCAGRGGSGRRTHKQLQTLEHAREAIEHFLERELVDRLNRHPVWESSPLRLGEVALTPGSIVAEVLCPATSPGPGTLPGAEEGPMRISFRNWSGWIVAGIDDAGWASDLGQRSAAPPDTSGPSTEWPRKPALLALALAGLYKLAGVDLVREQVDSVLATAFGLDAGGHSLRWDVRHDGSLIWLDGRNGIATAYSLADGAMQPKVLAAASGAGPLLDSGKLLLGHMPIAWQAWVNAWDPAAEPAACAAALNGTKVLPDVPLPELVPA